VYTTYHESFRREPSRVYKRKALRSITMKCETAPGNAVVDCHLNKIVLFRKALLIDRVFRSEAQARMVFPGSYYVHFLFSRQISIRDSTSLCLQSLEMLHVHCKIAAAGVQVNTLHTVSSLRSWSKKAESLTGWQVGLSIVEPGSAIRIPLCSGATSNSLQPLV
jgi:hypothetical protein